MRALFEAWRRRLDNLSSRDRRALLGFAVLILPLGLYQGIWHPARAAVNDARQALAVAEQTRARLDALVASGIAAQAAKPATSQMPELIQQLAQSDGVSIGRLETTAEGVRVSIAAVSMIRLTRFLQHCQGVGMSPVDAEIRRLGEGRHEVRLLFPIGA